MNLHSRLSNHIHMDDINRIILVAQQDENTRKELYKLALDDDKKISINALWIMTHCSAVMNEWLYHKQDELIDKVLYADNSSQRRLILTLLLKQPVIDPIRVDFLDFCLQLMVSQKEPHGVTTLCMKHAYKMCCTIPELLQEYYITINSMEPTLLPPSLRTTRKNILKEMKRRKNS